VACCWFGAGKPEYIHAWNISIILRTLEMKKSIRKSSVVKKGVLSSVSVIALAGLVALSGCTSTPVAPTRELQAAEAAITTAERARVADHASPELGEARNKLADARAAVQKEDMVVGQRLAEQSRVDAELAVAKAEAAKARIINAEMLEGIDVMKQEMQRNKGAQQ
jgi:hypothetical protein